MLAAGEDMPTTEYEPDQEFDSVGKCIYCSAHAPPLTEEHIVPFGLVGRLTLPLASCSNCQKIINKFETEVQQVMLGGFRARIDVPPRKGRKREYKIFVGQFDSDPSDMVFTPISAAEDFPYLISLPKLPLPLFFLSDWERAQLAGKLPDLWSHHDEASVDRFIDKFGAGATLITRENPFSLAQMLVKISWGFSWAHLGESKLKTYKQHAYELITKGGQPLVESVGCLDGTTKSNSFFEMRLYVRTLGPINILMCNIQLFSWLGAPTYAVIVGMKSAPIPGMFTQTLAIVRQPIPDRVRLS